MPKNQEKKPENIDWQVPEYDKHEKGKNWYIFYSLLAFLLIIYSFFSGNFLFAVIIIIAAVVIVLRDGQEPDLVKISLTEEGVTVGKKFHDYDEFKNFSIVYKPQQEIKNLYFEFNSTIRPRLSIPLRKMNPLLIRKSLLRYLPEDLDRTDRPLSEELGKLFKL
ncbi:MAG: hypothetical protein PHP21_01650 [Patescibacteria group bacterium]|nr:hypothetical protein [Patescibacteria group bacterium]MDD5555027.1 hypothetical protein [Patescibacteria group bacterium]